MLTGITNGQPATTHQGRVVRLLLDLTGDEPRLLDSTVIANNLAVYIDPAALIVGPTGLALGPTGDPLTVNGGNNMVDLATAGTVVATRNLGPTDPPGGASAWPPRPAHALSTTSRRHQPLNALR